jgi:hypothetical protein
VSRTRRQLVAARTWRKSRGKLAALLDAWVRAYTRRLHEHYMERYYQ